MGHYSEFYQAEADQALIEHHLPDAWKKTDLEHHVKVRIAKGCKAEKELAELKAAVKTVVQAAK